MKKISEMSDDEINIEIAKRKYGHVYYFQFDDGVTIPCRKGNSDLFLELPKYCHDIVESYLLLNDIGEYRIGKVLEENASFPRYIVTIFLEDNEAKFVRETGKTITEAICRAWLAWKVRNEQLR